VTGEAGAVTSILTSLDRSEDVFGGSDRVGGDHE
jgi:hypothetical protein